MILKKRVIIICCIVGYIIYALLTGGMYISNYDSFWGMSRDDLVFAEDLEGKLYMHRDSSWGGVVFVGFYESNQFPHPLHVWLWDETGEYASVTIETVDVEYADGLKNTIKPSLLQKFKPSELYDNTTSGAVYTSRNEVYFNFPDVFIKRCETKVRVTGFVITVSGEQIKFDVVEEFKYEHYFDITTYWEVWGSI